MLGIYLLVCLAIFWGIRCKAYRLLNDPAEPVVLDDQVRTYTVCRKAMILYAVSDLIALIGYLGCFWPVLLIEGLDRGHYIIGVVALGLFPVLLFILEFVSNLKNANGVIKFSVDEIQYSRHKPFTIKVCDVKKITHQNVDIYRIHPLEKGKKPLLVNLKGIIRRKEAYSLLKQLREYSARLTGRNKSVAHKWASWRLENGFQGICCVILSIILIYTSYCCIDYDFFKKDYVAAFNALYADPTQTENAWDYYVQAAANYVPLDTEIEEAVKEQYDAGNFILSEEKQVALKQWFDKNAVVLNLLMKAASIEYCNAAYEKISLFQSTGQKDFSTPSDPGYQQIRQFYQNASMGNMGKVIELDAYELLDMQLKSSRHFMDGKTFIDQLVGYSLLRSAIEFIGKQGSYELQDFKKARNLLNNFSDNPLLLKIDGEILMGAGGFEDMINYKKIPMQTPLNPLFVVFGSCSGSERYLKNRFEAVLEQSKQGIEPPDPFLFGLPFCRKMWVCILEPSIFNIYKISERTAVWLKAGYVFLDLEEYRLRHGNYPADISQLQQAGLTSELPDDPYSNSKIIYSNDGQRAILYSFGPNGKDDGGYRDKTGGDEKRDDIIYWGK